MGNRQKEYMDLDFGGFTCIESDYLYRHYDGALAVGDFAVFDNVGSYSITLKSPFILSNFPIIDITGEEIRLVKRQETFDDLFQILCVLIGDAYVDGYSESYYMVGWRVGEC